MSDAGGSAAGPPAWLIAVDIGGTFTDVTIADRRTGATRSLKTATDPWDPVQSFERGVRLAMDAAGAAAGDRRLMLHSTTLATNTILEENGARVAVITTAGFRHVLEIGRHDGPRRTSLLHWVKPARLVPPERVLEVHERTSHLGQIERGLDPEELRLTTALLDPDVEAVAVCLINAYAGPSHERTVGSAVQAARPGLATSLSSDVLPVYREYERLTATLLDAYIKPTITGYVGRLAAGLDAAGAGAGLRVMRSDGGLTDASAIERAPIWTVLSGPAAAVVAAAGVADDAGSPDAISIDVGGTSTDVALVRSGRPTMTDDGAVGSWPLALPIIDVHTIGAGGGSIAWVRSDGTPAVGPRSAGSRPGPACYGQGGDRATVTDAELVLGRIPDRLAGATLRLHPEAASTAIRETVARPLRIDPIEAAWGIVEIAEDSIAAAIRLITTERGHDPRTHVLVAGGGAGPLHATGVADRLGVTRVVVPRSAGVLATIGLLRTDLRHELVRTEVIDLGPDAGHRIRPILRDLARGARAWFASEAIPTSQQRLRWTVSMRYADQASELHVPWERPARAGRASIETLRAAFHERHRERFGYDMPASVVECVTIRAEATAERPRPRLRHAASRRRHRTRHPSRPVFVDRRLGFRPARILGLDDVRAAGVDGPVVIEPPDSTVWIPPHWQARRLASGDLLLQLIGSP